MTASPTSEEAIAAALSQNWKEAILINIHILKAEKNNTDAMNRLAFAYSKQGNIEEAKKFFKKVLLLDKYNQIASRNIKKLDSTNTKKVSSSSSQPVSPLMFLEEPGKTKIAQCVNPAPEKILSTLTSGEEIFLKAKKHVVEIRAHDGTYLAALPDDLSHKLIRFLAGGNRYSAIVKSVGKNTLIVFLREISRGHAFSNQPSFTQINNYIGMARGEGNSPSDKPDVSTTGEDEDSGTAEEMTEE